MNLKGYHIYSAGHLTPTKNSFCSKMAKLLYLFILAITTVYAQENAVRSLSPSLKECYENKYLLERDNRLPHTLETFIAILRKIENIEGLNMDLRSLSVALLHRFRQDGITSNPKVPIQDGITPYAPNAFQFSAFAHTLRLVPGNAITFPNNSITDVERCTLHFMLSSSVEAFIRGDESKVCRFANAYRYARDIKDEPVTESSAADVETLSSDEIQSITNRRNKGVQSTMDPNWLYPELPPNHPDIARYSEMPPISKCPVENGVIKTAWGPVAPGLVLAGIAAATQPETTMLYDLQPDILQKNNSNLNGLSLDNKWFATLAGDLAEVALRQGPTGDKLSVGVTGNWNSTALPRWYFLNSNEKYEMTTAEIRGDLDGLILADQIKKWYSKIPSLRLSQIFDMYYSRIGFFDSSIRACNRRTMFTSVAPNETMVAQTYSAALLLNPDLTRATLESTVIEKFSVQAVNELVTYVPKDMNKDLSCADTERQQDINKISVDLTIILDTNWELFSIQPILAYLLENIDVNQYNSNFTLINGRDGTPMINSTSNILDFHAYNQTYYQNITHGFDIAKSIKELEAYLMKKLDSERSSAVGGARSDVVLIIPYMSDVSASDKEYCLQTISHMRERIPDTTLLVMTPRSKDTWTDFVKDHQTDLFSINIGDTEESLAPINNVVSRIKQVPKRLINSQCGSDYIPTGSLANSYEDYILPYGTNFYRLHPNYFFNHENTATIKIRTSSSDTLTVCTSREALPVNGSDVSKSCHSITNDAHSITVSCADATFIHQCPPLYISVNSNTSSSSYQCTDRRVCRYPNLIKYTVSYENVVCVSSATKVALNSFVVFLVISLFNL